MSSLSQVECIVQDLGSVDVTDLSPVGVQLSFELDPVVYVVVYSVEALTVTYESILTAKKKILLRKRCICTVLMIQF